MVTQDLLSDLWGRYAITYKNVAIESSHGSEQTPSASTTLTPQAHNPDKSKGEYKAPLQIITVLPPMIKPRYRESNQMNPLEQKEKNLVMERFAVPDPRQNVTGKHVDANKRLDNMDIQIAPFNYPAIAGVIGILVAIALVIFITKGRG
mgnify:FL=1